MANEKSRFIPAIVLMVLGLLVAVVLVLRINDLIQVDLASYDLSPAIGGRFTDDVFTILMIALPAYLFEFLLLTLPVAALMLMVNRLYRAKSYTQSVVKTGTKFGAARIIRRAVVPALFALSFSQFALGLLPTFILNVPTFPETAGFSDVVRTTEPLVWFIGALLALGLAIPIYAPTWLLNDTGIVTHLKREELEMRRCPDTEGVGRWYSHYVSGFAVLSYPLATAQKFLLQLPTNIVIRGGIIGPNYFLESLLWIGGLPIVVMAFIMPLVILNEILLPRSSEAVRGIARRLGATDVTLVDLEAARFEEESESQLQDFGNPMEN
jgi:hypothetical protein